MTARLNVNIDHVATVREARKNYRAECHCRSRGCEQTGVHGITVHLRGDRRHIQDRDIELLRQTVTTYLNVEMAATDEMVEIAKEENPMPFRSCPKVQTRSPLKAVSMSSGILTM